MRIIDRMKQLSEQKKVFYSFEYFPPKTAEGVSNLFDRIDRMSLLEPLFLDVTWGAGGTTSEATIEISSMAQQMGNEVMMHLTCTNMKKSEILHALQTAKKHGIRNILALRGDPPKGADSWEQCESGFAHAIDLIKFIRQEFGDHFGIAVAGYPEGHITSNSLDEDIEYLRLKVEAGADFIVTQLFYDCDLFIDWMNKCRLRGITVPIIPGIMPIQNYNGFTRMTSFCRTFVPQEILSALEPIKEDDAHVKQYGIELAVKMCHKMLAAGVPGLHFYTLNLEKSVTQILEGLGYVIGASSRAIRLPWHAHSAVSHRRHKEDVRPIFWANRPHSYLERTMNWDEFPNGRWGDSASPAFGDLSDYHLCGVRAGSRDERRKLWGQAPRTPKDLYDIFVAYIKGSIPRLPWCENSLLLETVRIKEQLIRLNAAGFLTINSQPSVNGVPSDDSTVGWGGPGGYVYQKAYLEFFCSPYNLKRFESILASSSSFPSLSYTAMNRAGVKASNVKLEQAVSVNAVTWGVFPNKEIIQPTVVDQASFATWKDEAFALWTSQWRQVYEPGSPSYILVGEIYETYFLVNLVDNDFVKGDIFAVFDKLIDP